VAERDFFKSISQIPGRVEGIVKNLTIEYVHRTRQLCIFELKLIKLRNKRGRKR
jgi:hypothetical protein